MSATVSPSSAVLLLRYRQGRRTRQPLRYHEQVVHVAEDLLICADHKETDIGGFSGSYSGIGIVVAIPSHQYSGR